MWVKRLDDLMFAVLYLAQPYQLKRQDIHDLKYFLFYTILFVVRMKSLTTKWYIL